MYLFFLFPSLVLLAEDAFLCVLFLVVVVVVDVVVVVRTLFMAEVVDETDDDMVGPILFLDGATCSIVIAE